MAPEVQPNFLRVCVYVLHSRFQFLCAACVDHKPIMTLARVGSLVKRINSGAGPLNNELEVHCLECFRGQLSVRVGFRWFVIERHTNANSNPASTEWTVCIPYFGPIDLICVCSETSFLGVVFVVCT